MYVCQVKNILFSAAIIANKPFTNLPLKNGVQRMRF